MTDIFMDLSLGMGVVNIGLTFVLFVLYRKVYAQTKASFTLGLVAFAGAFLLQNILVVVSYLETMPLIPVSLSPYLFGIGASEAVGLIAVASTAFQ